MSAQTNHNTTSPTVEVWQHKPHTYRKLPSTSQERGAATLVPQAAAATSCCTIMHVHARSQGQHAHGNAIHACTMAAAGQDPAHACCMCPAATLQPTPPSLPHCQQHRPAWHCQLAGCISSSHRDYHPTATLSCSPAAASHAAKRPKAALSPSATSAHCSQHSPQQYSSRSATRSTLNVLKTLRCTKLSAGCQLPNSWLQEQNSAHCSWLATAATLV